MTVTHTGDACAARSQRALRRLGDGSRRPEPQTFEECLAAPGGDAAERERAGYVIAMREANSSPYRSWS